MHKMPSSFAVKKFLLFSVFLSVYVQYLIVRITDKKAIPRAFINEEDAPDRSQNLRMCFDPAIVDEVIKFSARKTPIYINYDTSISALNNAINLYKTYNLTYNNLLTVKALDVCFGDQRRCQACELSEFIRLYFFEASDKSFNNSTLQYFNNSRCFSPRVLKDFVEYELESLGLMTSLALMTQTFINVKFCKNIAMRHLSPNEKYEIIFGLPGSSFSLLSDFDQEQFDVYLRIERSASNQKDFGYNLNPKSRKVFLVKNPSNEAFVNDGFEILPFSAPQFPLTNALERMFLFPKIDAEFRSFFGRYLINYVNPYRSQGQDINPNYYNAFNVDFDRILGPFGAQIYFSAWRKHSSTSKEGDETIEAMFWDSLCTFSPEDIIVLFKHFTGIDNLPDGGIQRLPKTKVVTVYQRSNIVPDLFSYDKAKWTVYIRDDCHPKQLIEQFELFLKQKQN